MLSAGFLLIIAIWNGYPLVYSDTSTYLSSGFVLDTPIDRPITYGLFMRVCSLNGWSLWGVVLAQSLLLAHVLGLTLRSLGVTIVWIRSAVIGVMAITTGLPFITGQLITDVFTPILFVTLFLLLWDRGGERKERIMLFLLFLLSYAMHMSHIAIVGVVLVSVLVFSPILRRFGAMPKLATLIVLVVLSVAGTLAMGPSLSKSKNTFFAAKMAEHGILQRYLEKQCGSEDLILCERLGSIPYSADAFLWADDSPKHLYPDRRTMEAEFAQIRAGSFADGELRWMHVKAAVISIGQQLTRFAVGDGNGSFGPGTLLFERVEAYVPGEVGMYSRSRQMDKEGFMGSMVLFNAWYDWVMALCLLAIIILSFYWRRSIGDRSTLSIALVYLLIAYVLNAAVNAGLVMVADRFGTKMAWCIPFLLMVVILAIRDRRTRSGHLPVPE
jgi:hypothetical protein